MSMSSFMGFPCVVLSRTQAPGNPSAPLRHGVHTSATSPTAMSDLRAGTSIGAQRDGGGIERGFEPRDLARRPRASCLRAAAAAPRCFPRRARRPAIRAPCAWPTARRVPTRPTLVAEIALRPSNAPRIELPMDTAVCMRCWRELALFALAAFFGAADLILQLQQLRLPALAQLGDRGIALLARGEREARAEIAFGLAGLRGGLERVAPQNSWRARFRTDAPAGPCAHAA